MCLCCRRAAARASIFDVCPPPALANGVLSRNTLKLKTDEKQYRTDGWFGRESLPSTRDHRTGEFRRGWHLPSTRARSPLLPAHSCTSKTNQQCPDIEVIDDAVAGDKSHAYSVSGAFAVPSWVDYCTRADRPQGHGSYSPQPSLERVKDGHDRTTICCYFDGNKVRRSRQLPLNYQEQKTACLGATIASSPDLILRPGRDSQRTTNQSSRLLNAAPRKVNCSGRSQRSSALRRGKLGTSTGNSIQDLPAMRGRRRNFEMSSDFLMMVSLTVL